MPTALITDRRNRSVIGAPVISARKWIGLIRASISTAGSVSEGSCPELLACSSRAAASLKRSSQNRCAQLVGGGVSVGASGRDEKRSSDRAGHVASDGAKKGQDIGLEVTGVAHLHH